MGLFFWHALPTLQQNKFTMAGVQAKMVTNRNVGQKEKFYLLASEKKRDPHVKILVQKIWSETYNIVLQHIFRNTECKPERSFGSAAHKYH